MEENTYRILKKEDNLELKELFIHTLKSGFPEYSPFLDNYFISSKYLNKRLNLKLKIGAFNKNKMVGYLIAYQPHGGVMEIGWLAVKPEHQRKGIGSRLLKIAEKKALKKYVHNIQIQTFKRDVKFYTSQRYELLGIDKISYYGTDNYIMKKLIQTPRIMKFLESEKR